MSIAPLDLLSALERIKNELPELVGATTWNTVHDSLLAKLHALRTSDDPEKQEDLADDLVEELSLSLYDEARKRLYAELSIQAGVGSVLTKDLAELAGQFNLAGNSLDSPIAAALFTTRWSISPEDVPEPKELSTKSITLKDAGLGGAVSIKFQNMDINFDEALAIAAGTLLQGYAILDKPHPFVIAAGFLLLIHSLHKTMTVQISERDATVFWGFIQARNPDNVAPESAILDKTNQARDNNGLKPLNKHEFQNALVTLEALQSIAAVPGKTKMWRIIEKYKIGR